jgi:undecaprenyl-diphosphatase
VSSSGHLVLLGSRDRAFDVFLHAGTACALLVALPLPRPGVRTAVTVAPAALAGLALEGRIEERLGRGAVAVGQVVGGLGLLVADRTSGRRRASDASPRDSIAIGLAQACALVPGVSRNGATLTAARLLGFRRADAARISREAALPVIAGATALKLARRSERAPRMPDAAGFAAAFASTLAAARLVPAIDRLPLWPIALYRVALAVAVAARSASMGR